MEIEGNIVDDAGTDQAEAQELLRAFCDNGFKGELIRAAVVLGRQPADLGAMLDGDDDIDDDLVMKIRGIADERGISLE